MKMNLMHRKVLPEFLFKEGFVSARVRSFETYGRKTFAYITVPTMNERNRLERALEAFGVPVNKKYWPGAPIVEARVKHFRSFGWEA